MIDKLCPTHGVPIGLLVFYYAAIAASSRPPRRELRGSSALELRERKLGKVLRTSIISCDSA